tara:strand:- start:1765 stop:2715 length:951 start_codon:yes stop_codon:yes gene_type:complete
MKKKILPYLGLFMFIILSSSFILSAIDDISIENNKLEFNKNYAIYAPSIPNEINFCGESFPIKEKSLKERFDREILVNTYWQSQTIIFIKKANKYFGIIEPILRKNGVPDDFKYLAIAESGLSNIVSPSGATGFWQIMKLTGKERGLEISKEVDERYHIEKSTEAACSYLLEAFNKFNSWTLAAAAYNMGITGLEKQMLRQKANNYYDLLLNNETARYIFRITAIKEILENQKKYGFNLRKQDLYLPENYYEVLLDSSVSDLVDYSFNLKINYKILKELNPWLRQSYINNTKGKKYLIKVAKTSEAKSNTSAILQK